MGSKEDFLGEICSEVGESIGKADFEGGGVDFQSWEWKNEEVREVLQRWKEFGILMVTFGGGGESVIMKLPTNLDKCISSHLLHFCHITPTIFFFYSRAREG